MYVAVAINSKRDTSHHLQASQYTTQNWKKPFHLLRTSGHIHSLLVVLGSTEYNTDFVYFVLSDTDIVYVVLHDVVYFAFTWLAETPARTLKQQFGCFDNLQLSSSMNTERHSCINTVWQSDDDVVTWGIRVQEVRKHAWRDFRLYAS